MSHTGPDDCTRTDRHWHCGSCRHVTNVDDDGLAAALHIRDDHPEIWAGDADLRRATAERLISDARDALTPEELGIAWRDLLDMVSFAVNDGNDLEHAAALLQLAIEKASMEQ